MSYDLNLDEQDFNITFNIAYIFWNNSKASIRDLNGLTGKKAVKWIRKQRKFIEDNLEALEEKEWDKCQGWGSVEGTYAFLNKLMYASLKNPKGTWGVS